MLALLASLLTAVALAAEPDLILAHGKVFLGPGRYAQAVAVEGGRIKAVGADSVVLALKGAKTRVVDLKGRTVTPGFHDAHTHFVKGALLMTQVDLNGTSSLAEVQAKVARYAAENSTAAWILGRGWDQTSWPGGAYPTAADLDVAVTTRPAALTDADGHKLWLNTEAMRRITLHAHNPNLVEGQYLKGADGEPSGVFMDETMAYVFKYVPAPSREQKLTGLRKALALARENGVTAIDSMQGPVDYSPEEQVSLWRELSKNGEMTLRYFLYGRIDDPAGFAKLKKSAADVPRDHLDFIGLKAFVDGTIGDRTAALLAPYFDDAKTSGSLKHSDSSLAAMVERAHRDGFQVAFHAVGDRAVRQALDACEKSEKKAKEEERVLPSYPCRVEHIELVSPEDLPRFAALRAAASMQPSHMTYDREDENYNPNRLGARVKWAFAWKSLEDAGALLIFGTDWPVMPLPPRIALFAATTRRHFDGKPEGGWIPEQKIALDSAIEHYTADAARALGKEDQLGSIASGRLADLVVFDRDLFAASGLDLLKVEVDMTVLEGKVVYERAAEAPKP